MNTKDRALAYYNLLNFLKEDTHSETEDDKVFRNNTTEQISNRDKKYTELLEHFVKITKARNVLKEFFKWLFYLVIIISNIVLMVVVYQIFDKILSNGSIEQIIEAIPLLLTAMIGFVSTIITIPVTITKYLFSTKEDENITQIILHTQKHDTSGRQWAMDFKRIADDFENISGSRLNDQKKLEDDSKKGA